MICLGGILDKKNVHWGTDDLRHIYKKDGVEYEYTRVYGRWFLTGKKEIEK